MREGESDGERVRGRGETKEKKENRVITEKVKVQYKTTLIKHNRRKCEKRRVENKDKSGHQQ